MAQNFQAGDFLVFQLESGFALLRILAADGREEATIWHVAAYGDFFLDVAAAEIATLNPDRLVQSHPHIALTNRAFESTQVAQISNFPLGETDVQPLTAWRNDSSHVVSDRSVRLMLGLR